MKKKKVKFQLSKEAKAQTKFNFFLFFGIAVVCLSLLIFTLSVMNKYTDTVEDKISDKSRFYAATSNTVVSEFLLEYEGAAQRAAGALQDQKDLDDFYNKLAELRGNNTDMKSPRNIRYVDEDGRLHNANTLVNASPNFSNLVAAAKSGQSGSFGSVVDPDVSDDGSNVSMEMLAFYAPITNNPNAVAVILFYAETVLNSIPNLEDKIETVTASEFVLLCAEDGRVVRQLYPIEDYDGAFSISLNDNLNKAILNNIHKESAREEVQKLLVSDELNAATFNIDSEKYAMSIAKNTTCDDYMVVSLYRENQSDSEQSSAFSSIGAMLVVLCLTIPAVFFIILNFKRQQVNREKRARNYDEAMQCPTLAGMEDLIPKQLQKFPGSNFAVVGGRLKHFQYVKMNYPEVAANLLYQVRRLLDTALSIGEVVGLGNESEFVLLLHYRETQSLTTRLYNLSNYITDNIGNNQYNVHLDFGVFEIEKDEKEPARQMIENAFSVIESDASNSAVTTVSIYNIIFRENYMKNAEVEVKMDYALQHDEFKVFFQPKINSETDAIDGCEALVRWLDPESGQYRAPGTFLPLFEQNGFIVKLDRYVFYKVCEFIGMRVSEHLPIFPTSVNISRVSAINNEFLEYYASVKKQFGVPDDFLTLELTESIAASSYEALNRMSVAFHKNHFLLSIDDFGSGYSSMNVLKNVVVDEIKMDRMFLDAGVSESRDKTIMASIVTLAKDLNIKVVQEGVETEEQLAVVREAGCKVIQGFYYSKPLSIPEYVKFVNMKMDEENRRARQRTYKNLDVEDLPPENETDIKIV